MLVFNQSLHRFFLALVVLLAAAQAVADKKPLAGRADLSAYDAFGRDIAESLNAQKGEVFSRAIDQDYLIKRIFRDFSRENRSLQGLREGVGRGFDQVGTSYSDSLHANGRASFIRSRFVDNTPKVLLRLYFGDLGVGFMELELHKAADGKILIRDWYDYANGSLFSDTVRQNLLLVYSEQDGLLERFLGVGHFEQDLARQFRDLVTLARQGEHEQWFKIYGALKPEVKYSRVLLLMRTEVANASNDEKLYRAALTDLASHFGEDPTLGLMLVDHYFYEKSYDKAQQVLDRFIAHLGGDAALSNLKSSLYLAAGDYEQAIAQAQRAIAQDVNYQDAYWVLLNARISLRHYPQALEVMGQLEHTFALSFDAQELAAIPEYADFAQSAAFKQWRQGR